VNTLPDYLAPDLRIISVGLNPSPNSVRCGYPYATPQNRFWRALNGSRLVAADYPPGVATMRRLLEFERIGFTDVVKRPTPGAADLKAGDFRQWAPVALTKLRRLAPRVVWFQGKLTYRNFMRYAQGIRSEALEWGAQERLCTGAAVFVTPNPSAANAAYSLGDIVNWMDRLALFVTEDEAGEGC
jgi:TDG/mug DNA glycosylase family protein